MGNAATSSPCVLAKKGRGHLQAARLGSTSARCHRAWFLLIWGVQGFGECSLQLQSKFDWEEMGMGKKMGSLKH